MIDFELLWQPIVKPNDPPNLPPRFIAAGQLQIKPPNGQDVDAWWEDRLNDPVQTSDMAQGQWEFRLTPYLEQMQQVRRWHIPLNPDVRPATRDMLRLWNDDNIRLNLVYELPVDREVDYWVWNEIELIRNYPNNGAKRPALAASHVGRSGFTPELAEALNNGPFSLILLDPQIAQNLSGRMGQDATNDARFEALGDFLDRLRRDHPVIATGIRTMTEWKAVNALGVKYGQGDLWMPPSPMEPTFLTEPMPFDPEIYPETRNWMVADRLIPTGLSIFPERL